MSQSLILPQYPGDFSLDGHTHNYASASHTHSQYLTSHQSLTNYATKTYVDNAVAGIDTSTVPSHTHDYASSSHTHSYASTSHTHSGYASSSHSHSGYASSSHTHSASDISGLSTGGGSAGWSLIGSKSIALSLTAAGQPTYSVTASCPIGLGLRVTTTNVKFRMVSGWAGGGKYLHWRCGNVIIDVDCAAGWFDSSGVATVPNQTWTMLNLYTSTNGASTQFVAVGTTNQVPSSSPSSSSCFTQGTVKFEIFAFGAFTL